MPKSATEMVGEAKAMIAVVSPQDAKGEADAGPIVFLDVREPVEWEHHITGAVQVPHDFDVDEWARPEFLEKAAEEVLKEEWARRSWSKLPTAAGSRSRASGWGSRGLSSAGSGNGVVMDVPVQAILAASEVGADAAPSEGA